MAAVMSDDPRIYRERAAECAELAARAPAGKFKAQLLTLAQSLQARAIEAERRAQLAEDIRMIYA
jgi:hypothetical protein